MHQVKILRWESSALCQYFNSWCSLFRKFGNMKESHSTARRETFTSENQVQLFANFSKTLQTNTLQKTPIGNFSSERFHIYHQNLSKMSIAEFCLQKNHSLTLSDFYSVGVSGPSQLHHEM